MPRWWWRLLAVVTGTTAAYAALVRHDGTICHDLVRTTFRTDTLGGKLTFVTLIVVWVVHVLRWPKNRPRPARRLD